jgi:hypothetical protein
LPYIIPNVSSSTIFSRSGWRDLFGPIWAVLIKVQYNCPVVLPDQFFKCPPKWSIRKYKKSSQIKSNGRKLGGNKEKKKQKQESQVVDLVIQINQHHCMQDDFCPNVWVCSIIQPFGHVRHLQMKMVHFLSL